MLTLLGAALPGALSEPGTARHADGVLFLCQALALLALGAWLRWRGSFLGGVVGTATATALLLIDPLRAVDAWYLVGAAGAGIVAAAVVAERRRQRDRRVDRGLAAAPGGLGVGGSRGALLLRGRWCLVAGVAPGGRGVVPGGRGGVVPHTAVRAPRHPSVGGDVPTDGAPYF